MSILVLCMLFVSMVSVACAAESPQKSPPVQYDIVALDLTARALNANRVIVGHRLNAFGRVQAIRLHPRLGFQWLAPDCATCSSSASALNRENVAGGSWTDGTQTIA